MLKMTFPLFEHVKLFSGKEIFPFSKHKNHKDPLFEEMSVQRSVRGRLHGHLQHLHTFFQPGVSCAKPSGLESLSREGVEDHDELTLIRSLTRGVSALPS